MNSRLETLKQAVLEQKHHKYRVDMEMAFTPAELNATTADEWEALVFQKKCQAEKPVILPEEKIVFSRSICWSSTAESTPHVYREKKFGLLANNMSADWGKAIGSGLLGLRKTAEESMKKYAETPASVAAMQASITTIDAVLDLAARYADEAARQGRKDIADTMRQVPALPPRCLREALQSLKFLQSCLWLCSCHVGLGRFDQYMMPYYHNDLATGRITEAEAEELIAEFFISLNKDIDMYPGVQPGDNGQALILGGVTRDGKSAVNDLTWMTLRTSREVNMIDPKINLRVDRNTSLDLLREASKLTRCGLGFPQYCNDDVIIPAMVKHNYSLEDARDYSVAACWEIIIPGRAMDVPNINALSFPAAVDQTIRSKLGKVPFEDLEKAIAANIREQVIMYVNDLRRIQDYLPSPYYSVLMTNCLERGKDINHGGCDYYNYGIHGSGSANAADALATMKKMVYDEKSVKPGEILDALWRNWEGHEELRQKILNSEIKVGNHSPEADAMLKKLFDWFADACEEIKDNGRGGIVRPGTGTAMFYVWLGDPDFMGLEPTVGATADGRKVRDFFASSLAPSPGAKVAGPLGVLQSYSKLDYSRICNGGPITMELSDTVFRNDDDLTKVAMLVSSFVKLGCQELQMNVLNPAILEDARKHPEKHRNLIVRVWGWSGYFVELAPEYQDHIIKRNTFAV